MVAERFRDSKHWPEARVNGACFAACGAADGHGFRTAWGRSPDPRSGTDFSGVDGVPATAAQEQDRAVTRPSPRAIDCAT